MDIFYSKCEKTKNSQHNIGRAIVQYAAKNFYQIENSEIQIVNNKPKFKNSDIEFSISHSLEMVAVCFDKSPVGMDIEKVRPKDFKPIAQRMNFDLKIGSLDEFYELWTLYEAVYKLQQTAKSKYTTNINEYKISVASSETTDIKQNIKFYDVTSLI